MAYYSLEIHRVSPGSIGHVARRGWISEDGIIYSGEGDHDGILTRILNSQQKPGQRSGWIRWLASVSGTLYIDWSEYGNEKSELLARSLAKQIDYPFNQVWIDAKNDKGQWIDWKGSIDDFIKFGIKGRTQQFESRLTTLLLSI